jgi:hypothetical protein
VGTSLGHRLEGVGRGQYPGGDRDVACRAAAVIAGAVEALVVHTGQRRHWFEGAGGLEDAL